MGGMVTFVCLVYLVCPVFLVKKIHFVFLFMCLSDKIDGIDERDEIDLLTESGDRRGGAVTGPTR
jgi:hypothetical protein